MSLVWVPTVSLFTSLLSNLLARWNIVFNLPIPGWLPETSCFGDRKTGVRYTLFATATLIALEDNSPSSSSWFSTLCSPFTSRQFSLNAKQPITIRRYASAPSLEEIAVPTTDYLVKCEPAEKQPSVPFEILEKIKIAASAPAYGDVGSNELPVTIRLRSKDLSEDDCQRISLTRVAMDLVQKESVR
jgi:hypothetical protein